MNYRLFSESEDRFERNPTLGHAAYPADPPDPPEVVAASAARTLPSTRAGGQDDVSYNKLPQTTGMCYIRALFFFNSSSGGITPHCAGIFYFSHRNAK